MLRSGTGSLIHRMKITAFLSIVAAVTFSTFAAAATKSEILAKKTTQKNIFYSASQLRSQLKIPLSVKSHSLDIPKRQISARLEKTATDPRIEPFQLTVSNDEDRLLGLVEKIARPNAKLQVANYLKTHYPTSESIPGTSLRLVSLDKSTYEQLKPDAISALFSKKHHMVSISGNYLRRDLNAKDDLLRQLEPFLTKSELSAVRFKISEGETLRLDKDLLPAFAKQRVGRHTVFKGPNCFHAALAFQSDVMASSSLVNIREEPGYHRNMVNYDELWRALQISFYEVNPIKTPLQYGDMIVFFETGDQLPGGIDFKTLRHAATYLFGGYVFSKGSKSANSPYVVSTLGEEWDTWSKYTKKLGLKVFRRSLKNVTKAAPLDPVDWVY